MADRGRTCRTPTAQLRTADCTDAAPRIELRTAEVVVYIGRIATAAERAVAGRAVANGRLRAPRFSDVLAAAEADEPWALDLLRDRARAVGRAAALLLDVINPQMLVVREAGTARRPELLADLRGGRSSHAPRRRRGRHGGRRLIRRAGARRGGWLRSTPRNVRATPRTTCADLIAAVRKLPSSGLATHDGRMSARVPSRACRPCCASCR
jgi:hypothetical protein